MKTALREKSAGALSTVEAVVGPVPVVARVIMLVAGVMTK